MINRFKACVIILKNYPKVILFLSSCALYLFFSCDLIFKGNSSLSSSSGDALKNYYTYMHHSVNDTSFWHFGGMAYPFGEHVVFTDAIPLLSGVLQQLPALHPYLIGLLHGLLFFSFVISPLILYDVFKLLGAKKYTGFWLSLSIALLNPQWIKIQHGHFALAFGSLIILTVRENLKWYLNPRWSTSFKNTALYFLLFFIHPYLGFGSALLGLCFTIGKTVTYRRVRFSLQGILFSVAPLCIFKIILYLTDTHANRPNLPYGNLVLIENLRSLIDPEFGIFKNWASFLPERTAHYEGHSYIGFAVLIWMCCVVFFSVRYKTYASLNPLVWPLSIAVCAFLAFSFGYPIYMLQSLHISVSPLMQFRANCRFAWYVYMCLPLLTFIFTKPLLDHFIKPRLYRILPLCFFAISLLEASAYFNFNATAFWKFPNVFKWEYLNAQEQRAVKLISKHPSQALMPLPVYAIGSERFDRLGTEASLYTSVVLGYHCNRPIISAWLSRSSQTETAGWLELLNPYDKIHKSVSALGRDSIMLVLTPDSKLPQEKRLEQKIQPFYATPQFTLGQIHPDNLKLNTATECGCLIDTADVSHNIIYLPHAKNPPFTWSRLKGSFSFLKIPAQTLKSGTYILSLHWKSLDSSYKSVAANVLITQTLHASFKWAYFLPVNRLSGFYSDHYVFECEIYLNNAAEYECLIEGHGEVPFSIEHVLLRPINTCVKLKSSKGILLNGYLQ